MYSDFAKYRNNMAGSTLGYWDIRGSAQPIRLLLTYAGERFTDKTYSCGGPPDFNKECWLKEKFKLGLDFPNLPYYVDDKVKLTQSGTILRYVGRKYKLDGATCEDKHRIDLMTDELADVKTGYAGLCYNPNFASMKDDYLKNFTEKLKTFEDYLGDRDWITGNKISFADFLFYEVLDQHRSVDPSVLDSTPKLQAFTDRFEALPQLKTYLTESKQMPINNKMAAFIK